MHIAKLQTNLNQFVSAAIYQCTFSHSILIIRFTVYFHNESSSTVDSNKHGCCCFYQSGTRQNYDVTIVRF